jgi:hypothetical protein
MNLAELTNDELQTLRNNLDLEILQLLIQENYKPNNVAIRQKQTLIRSIVAELEIRKPVTRTPNDDTTNDDLILTPNELLFGWTMVGTSTPNDEPQTKPIDPMDVW